jgi:hypothetical protein
MIIALQSNRIAEHGGLRWGVPVINGSLPSHDPPRRGPARRDGHVPHTFVRWGHVEDAAQLLRGLATLPAERFALAEATNSVLCTSDEKLSKGHRARVVLFTH